MISFILNNQTVHTDHASGSALLDFIRYEKLLRGTKIGCREGDCGACTVLVGDIQDGELRYQSMTSCLLPLANVQGKHVLTVEGINQSTLTPVQQLLVETNGTQCGFCTIGFVMSLTGFALDNKTTFEKGVKAVDGNICRCTGYKSIERAIAGLVEKLDNRPDEKTLDWLIEQGFVPAYLKDIKERLLAFKQAEVTDNQLETVDYKIAGGTDLMVQKHHALKKAKTQHLVHQTQLKGIKFENNVCQISAGTTVTELAESIDFQRIFPNSEPYFKLVSSTPIRNMATVGGNLVNASPIGDLSIFFLALDSTLLLANGEKRRLVPLKQFFLDYKKIEKTAEEIIESISFEVPQQMWFFNFEKVSKRTHLDIASFNSACQIVVDTEGVVVSAHISGGGLAAVPKYFAKASAFLIGKKIEDETVAHCLDIAESETSPISDARGSVAYKKLLFKQLLRCHFHKYLNKTESEPPKIVSIASENFDNTKTENAAVNIDAVGHVTGRSVYVDDMPVMEGTVFIKVFDAPIAHGKITHLDYSEAENTEGVIKIFSHKDIVGRNQIGGIVEDEPLLAEDEIHFWGQPILLIVAENEDSAEEALKRIRLETEALPVITSPREAYKKGSLLHNSRTFSNGNVQQAFENARYIFEGVAESGGQEHLYLETQGAYAYPTEQGGVKVHSSTQGPTQVQRTIAKVLGVGMHQVEVDVTRLGGGFGGKEDQASGWAAMVALVAFVLKKPAKIVLHRMEDMRMTGKRHPYQSDYKIGLDEHLNIVAYKATFFQNGGAAADLSPAVMERTLFHATNAYAVPNVEVTAHCCKTNLPPNTAFRGFGGPQGMFVMESAIHHAARSLGVSVAEIQKKNLVTEGYELSYGQVLTQTEAQKTWQTLEKQAHIEAKRAEIADFNAKNKFVKKGMAVMPICFGISFTNTMMNHARALVHIYSDGTVSVSTGAVEMGQGVNTKMMQIVAQEFGLKNDNIRLATTNTLRVANTSPSAASATADLNGKAVLDACQQLKTRLVEWVKTKTNSDADIVFESETVSAGDAVFTWKEIVFEAFTKRINLSAKGHYATPEIHFDKKTEKGHPFAYHVYGSALFEVTIDCLRGTYDFDAVQVVHDFGKSMSSLVDLGQIEGGLVQGMGWMTMEEVVYNEQGKLLSNALSTYKVPDIYAVPRQLNVSFLDTEGHDYAIYKSKAVGEPPLMYGIGAYFALVEGILAFNPKASIEYIAPMTPERVLMALYSRNEEK
ncbi:MAG: molybdopterin-dependent oxidoreductase [Saprospiraceae bacterium]|nr:molybdopterin-dependent oxidoreductase [Saprospiraceae bacterium]